MAILQALLSLLSRSLGKIMNAIFGWAVVALFGRTSPKQQTALSVLVGAAAIWPVLLLGIAVPRLSVLVLSFVPLSNRVPSFVVRLVWLGLALLVPIAVGIAMASKAPPGGPPESRIMRLLRGFPMTLGIASAFLFLFVTVPLLRLVSLVRGWQDQHVPCITESGDYDVVRMQIGRVLREHRIDAGPAKPSWWLSTPATVLRKLGGRSVRGFLPPDMAYWKGPALQIAFYPSDVLIRGAHQKTGWTHGLLAEALVDGPALQTFDPEAQALERRVRRLWDIHDHYPDAHEHSAAMRARVRELVEQLAIIKIDYEDWQVLYRQIVQLDRARGGQPQLLESLALEDEVMDEKRRVGGPPVRPLEEVSTKELLREVASQGRELFRKELDLAKVELRQEARQGKRMGEEAAAAGVCALLTLSLLLVSAALALGLVLPAWGGALIVAAVPLALAIGLGLDAWRRRVREPLPRTKHSVQETLLWAKERTI